MKTKYILSLLITIMVLSSMVGATEIRGTVATGNQKWDTKNFAGFYYDLDKDQGTETLEVKGILSDGRTIPDDGLVYTTSGIDTNFEVYDNENHKLVDNEQSYSLVGWQAEQWVAINGKVDKLGKLLVNMGASDKVTLSSGEVWDMGSGYTLRVQAVDAKASPRQAWIVLKKGDQIIDEGVVQEKQVYTVKKNIAGESDALLFTVYTSSIFSGTKDMIQLKYGWLVDETSIKQIKSGDKYGVFTVSISGNTITLTNDNSITLSSDSEIDLMGNMKFKVADDSANLRYYPKVDIETTKVIPVSTPVVTNVVTPVVTQQVVEKQVPPTVESCKPLIDAAVAAVPTVTITSVPTVVQTVVNVPPSTKPTPGFEAGLAIAGLLAVAFLVLRQRK